LASFIHPEKPKDIRFRVYLPTPAKLKVRLPWVLDWGNERWAIEIKLTSDPSPEAIARLHKTADMIEAARRVLVCRTPQAIQTDTLLVADLATWLRSLMKPPPPAS